MTVLEAMPPNAAEVFAGLAHPLPVEAYNYEHFRTRHLLRDLAGTWQARGIRPGERAPDFELPRAGSGSLRLSDLRDQPVLLRFGSWT